ncbi:hypothetical protein HZA87_01050 [Candidatus Uhrbacteria bacterium]|nr:hypothetical protein [Candidatus Uhrbacteria bacterium]
MFFLKRQLNRLARQGQPPKAFRDALWLKLSQERACVYPDIAFRPHGLRWSAVGLTALVVVFTMGTGVYAYESPDVVEGHPLYVVKQTIESVEKGLARTPEARAEFHSRMMARRLEEGEHHLSRTPQQAQEALNAAADQLEQSVEELPPQMQDPEGRAKMIQELSIHNARYLELSARVQKDEAENREPAHLRSRIEGHGLSQDEQVRLFERKARASDLDVEP